MPISHRLETMELNGGPLTTASRLASWHSGHRSHDRYRYARLQGKVRVASLLGR
jgi:hypothetical protein